MISVLSQDAHINHVLMQIMQVRMQLHNSNVRPRHAIVQFMRRNIVNKFSFIRRRRLIATTKDLVVLSGKTIIDGKA